MTQNSTAGTDVAVRADARTRLDRARLFAWLQTIGIVILVAVILATPGFLAGPSILALLTTVSFIGCVAIGMTLITISGNIMSFALGATVGVTAMVFILAANRLGFGAGLLVGVVFGSLLTGLQGLLIGSVRANPIIISIAALALIYGVTQVFSEKGTIYADQGTVPALAKGKIAGVPIEFVVFLVSGVIAQFILSATRFGRNLFMVGSSFRAAEAVGVSTWRTITGAYLWAGFFTSLAGIMLAIRYDSANMDYGVAYDYDAIAAVLVGGTAIGGGSGSALRTFAGAMVIAAVQVMLLLKGLRQEWQYLAAGLIVLAVIVLQLAGPHWRPFTVLAACILLLAALDGGQGAFLSAATAYSTLQIFATVSLVTLGLGLTMMIREFDLSVVGMYGMAGCIAVLTGTQHPWLGFFLALAIGFAAGIAQGFIIVRLNLSSVGVTLGGLLVFVGIAFVLTESRSLPYDNLAVALLLNERFRGIFSIRSVVALAFFASAAMIFAWTRLGRDIIAIGSDRRAAMTTGVKVDVLIIGIFAFSGLCAALSGVLLSYSLASASPAGLSDVIAPAAAGAILGGISLGGGTGRPLGIAAGALTLAVLRSGLNAVGAPPFVNDIAMGAVLLMVAVLDGPDLARRLIVARRLARRSPTA